uniref:GIY-YIG endonuclease n=1 Tax=Parasitella parasitica TaxID=35722 RepID=A0A088S6V0_9FUNG|nr:GIY-YIG endonuclease [Parasitella parasitica]AIO05752.1 GIY-YIG endonuclease [Parasitella parasitica]
MLMGLTPKLQLYIYNYLVRFSSSNYYTKSNSSITGENDLPSENSEKPNKNKDGWLASLSKEMKEKFELAREFMRTNKKANTDIINKLLDSNISETDLHNLLNGPKILFTDLSDRKSLTKMITKTGKDFGSLSGVYIWTHVPSNKKYVGSAIHLPTRLRSYFLKTINIGKFLPILNNYPISEFNLEVRLTPYSSNFRNEMVLKQYFLLDKTFNMNTIRVSNNPSGSNAKSLFMYNRDLSILYYSSTKQIDFIRELGIHHSTFTKHLNNGTFYLGKYVFTKKFVETAQKVDLNMFDLLNMLEKDRIKFNVNKPVNSLSTSVILIDASTQEKHFFLSLGSALKFLKYKGCRADQRTLVKRLDTNILYYGYNCKKAPLK